MGTRFYNGLNLSGVNAYVTVLLKDGSKFEQANDKTIHGLLGRDRAQDCQQVQAGYRPPVHVQVQQLLQLG